LQNYRYQKRELESQLQCTCRKSHMAIDPTKRWIFWYNCSINVL